MPQESNEQRPTTPEAASKDTNAVLKNTPPKSGRNAHYSPDSALALMFHIQRRIFDMREITMETAFCNIFLVESS
jgi:hypothetical protein